MINLIGRKAEIEVLERVKTSNRAEFVAIYGRRRVGKTYLIKQFYEENFTFHLTGMANSSTPLQIGNFISAYRQFTNLGISDFPKDWFEGCNSLIGPKIT